MFFTIRETKNLWIVFTKFYVSSFRVVIVLSKTVSLAYLISIVNFYLIKKQNKEFNDSFVDSGIVKTCDELDLWILVYQEWWNPLQSSQNWQNSTRIQDNDYE